MSKKERLFVIMEVEKEGTKVSEWSYYNIVGSSNKEWVRCKPSRIIPESRLRRATPNKGETYFSHNLDHIGKGWRVADSNFSHDMHLILDPEPVEEKKDEWDEWADEIPGGVFCDSGTEMRVRNWLKRMPRREDGTT